ncbi:PREDICTED: ATP-binding cassette sub-family C member 9-like [Priapulus caudatus]|uniref:ATP-binding cassette sub-family C member 9-like n=1 Tax=Priapulus caudatus TaxID=37621 RepID=A0ABM1EHD2_PRICU|nr:PREDICTED: ATP-binding cassette sub-family C member 9-like [Priapulus caudatus]
MAILKPGKDSASPASDRLISLLCHTYKLFKILILNRLTPYVDKLLIPEQEHSAEQQYLQFRAVYKQEEEAAKRAGRRPSLWRCYARVSWRTMVYTGVCKLFAVLLVFVGPWVIGRIIVFLSRTSTDADTVAPGNQTAAAVVDVRHLADNGYVLSLLLFLASLLHHTLTQSFMLHALVKGVHLRAAIQMFVYDKSLRLALWSHGGASTAPGSDAIPALANCDKTGATEMVSLAAGRGSHRETSGGNRADAEMDGVS